VKLIGIEEHFLTAEIRQAWEAIGLDAVDPSVAFHSGAIESSFVLAVEESLARRWAASDRGRATPRPKRKPAAC